MSELLNVDSSRYVINRAPQPIYQVNLIEGGQVRELVKRTPPSIAPQELAEILRPYA